MRYYGNAAQSQFERHFSLLSSYRIKALLAACKPLILLDFHRSFNDTRTIGVSRSDTPIFCCGFLDFLILLEGIVQLFPLGSLYAEGLILYFIQEGSYDLRKLQLPHQADPAPQSILRQRKVEDSHHTKVSEETRRF